MWNLTSYDINRIKGQLQARKARIDARYAEDTKALDADFADLETLERVAAGLALKYKADEQRPGRKIRLALAPGSARPSCRSRGRVTGRRRSLVP